MKEAPGAIAESSSPDAAADLREQLLATRCELARLQALLDDSCAVLQQGFLGAVGLLQDLAEAGRLDATAQAGLRQHLLPAVEALQFQDLATQLIGHSGRRLQHCADRAAHSACGADGPEGDPAAARASPLPSPVAQSAMQAGTVELF